MTHPLPAVSQFVCGQPVTRVDGQLKVTGKARYAADNHIPGLAYATLVCSTVARGRVNHMDTSAALRHHDMLRVLTDFTGVNLPFDTRQVSYFGQPLAVVIATILEAAAAHGASLVDVRYLSRPMLTDVDAPQAVTQPSPALPNVARERLNALIRGEYAGHHLFALAAIESTKPDGTRVSGRYDNQGYFALYDGYASDMGHLNAVGSKIAATAFLEAIAQASRK